MAFQVISRTIFIFKNFQRLEFTAFKFKYIQGAGGTVVCQQLYSNQTSVCVDTDDNFWMKWHLFYTFGILVPLSKLI